MQIAMFSSYRSHTHGDQPRLLNTTPVESPQQVCLGNYACTLLNKHLFLSLKTKSAPFPPHRTPSSTPSLTPTPSSTHLPPGFQGSRVPGRLSARWVAPRHLTVVHLLDLQCFCVQYNSSQLSLLFHLCFGQRRREHIFQVQLLRDSA